MKLDIKDWEKDTGEETQEELKKKYFPQKICIDCGQPKHEYSHLTQPTMTDIEKPEKCTCGSDINNPNP